MNLIFTYLAQTAYQVGYYELSEEASHKAASYFSEKTGIKDREQDYVENPLYLRRLKSKAVKGYSQNELRMGAINFIIHARCLQRKYKEAEKNSKTPLIPIQKQRNTLHVCNYLLMALELAQITKAYPIAKRIIKELYNDVLPFLTFKTKSKFIYQILSRAQLVLCQIPKELWDGAIRNCSVKITYEILKMTQQINEIRFSKIVLYHDSRLPHRKWFIVSKTIMVEEGAQPDSKDSKEDKKAKKAIKGKAS
mmetsp:Transcript_8681/g.7634  ORF Transcript_8681/g.7634 Transcript_8681/m.7634 type:complete len:251 (-) Transcript_8681:305-1057(-)